MLKNSRNRNVSNYFVKSRDISIDIAQVLSKVKTGVFGLGICINNKDVGYTIITPPHFRIEGEESTSTLARYLQRADTSFYEGYLSHPFFLPLYTELNGEFISSLEKVSEFLLDTEEIYVQWLFKYRDNWKDMALKMYTSYLYGNDFPLYSPLGRGIQNSIIKLVDKIVPTAYNPYLEAAENKIVDEGFQFRLTVAVVSNSPQELSIELSDALSKYNAYNSLKLIQVAKKHLVTPYALLKHSNTQILSKTEILALLGGNDTHATNSLNAPVLHSNFVGDSVLELLPKHVRGAPTMCEDIFNDIAEALKRVGIIKTARLYNQSVIQGVRLTVVQCDIPKGKNLSHITNKASDIQAALGVLSLSVEQGEEPDTVKFVIPNETPAIISLRELIELPEFQEKSRVSPLTFVVGVDEINNPLFLSMSELVHLLVAGTTGSGKSVFLNTLIVSLLSTYSPNQLKMYMVDPKEVELQQYKDFPHVEEVITDMNKATILLQGLVKEMDNRYKQLREAGVKNIHLYNQSVGTMAYIVVVIDEYADLKDTNPEVEGHIARLGQKARAAGIHLVIATQRPSTNIISGRVKAVIPNTISFNLNNNTNYRTVFGTGIKYSLLGKGDGVMKIEGYPKEFQRFQSAIVAPNEAQEAEVYKSLIQFYLGNTEAVQSLEPVVELEVKEEDEKEDKLLYRLKEIISTTRETRVVPLREIMKVKTTTMTELMSKLVEEGWLKKHESKAKGYELIAAESILDEWKTKD